jgi:hypothetical protein
LAFHSSNFASIAVVESFLPTSRATTTPAVTACSAMRTNASDDFMVELPSTVDEWIRTGRGGGVRRRTPIAHFEAMRADVDRRES